MISYSTASKYCEIFEELSDPYAIMIVSYLFEHDGEFTADQIAKEIRTTDDKVTDICEELVDLEVFESNEDESDTRYFLADYDKGNFVEDVIRRID